MKSKDTADPPPQKKRQKVGILEIKFANDSTNRTKETGLFFSYNHNLLKLMPQNTNTSFTKCALQPLSEVKL